MASSKSFDMRKQALAKVASLFRVGRIQQARAEALKLLKVYPEALELYEVIGLSFAREKKFENAVAALKVAVKHRPKEQALRLSLAKVQVEVRQHESAERHLRKIDPKGRYGAERALVLGDIYVKQGNHDLALAAYDVAKADPKLRVKALNGIGKIKRERLESDLDVDRELQSADSEGSRSAVANRYLTRGYGQLTDEMRAFAEDFTASREGKEIEVSKHLFRVARLHFHDGEWEKSAQAYKEFNAAKFQEIDYDKDDLKKFEKLFENTRTAALPNVTPRPHDPKLLLILGVSTSGKSTLEKLLEPSDKTILRYETVNTEAMKELGKTKDRVRSMNQRNEVMRRVFFIPKTITDLRNRVVVGTLPAIIFRMPILIPLFPTLHVIHIQKDPRRLAIDVLAKKYTRGNEYAYDPQTAKIYIESYQKQMDIVADRLGDRFLRIPQAALKDDPAGVVKQVESLIGMDLGIEAPQHTTEILPTPEGFYKAMAEAFGLEAPE